MTDDKSMERVSNVRDAFNSPFRPFVLNSTSIGQEGLDFHWYCSQMFIWNHRQILSILNKEKVGLIVINPFGCSTGG